MSKSLLGGGAAAAVALLSASLIFQAQTSVAEPLASVTLGQQSQQRLAPAGSETPKEATPDPAAPAISESTPATAADANLSSPVGATNKAEDAEETTQTPVQAFTATAYSLHGRTASGRMVTRGLIAADHRVLPLGTRVRLEAGTYSGEYLVADTGGLVRGRKIDIWVPNSGEAMRFGRRTVKLTVLTYGGRRATQTGARSRK